jgi:hypothetical protein
MEACRKPMEDIPFPAFKHYLIRRTAYQVAQLRGWKSIPAINREKVIHVAMELARALPAPSAH